MTSESLSGKVALITGAARGQGRVQAVRVAEAGADVIAVDICSQIESVPYPMATREDLSETERLIEKAGRRVIAVQADIRDHSTLERLVGEAVHELGRLDLVSANAGIGIPESFLDKSPESWRDTLDTNLTGAFHTVKVAIPHIIAGGRGGSVVLTGSTLALQPAPNLADYVAAKHGIVGLARAAALELAKYSIRVNSVHPSTCDTPMLQSETFRKLFVPGKEEPTREDLAAVTSTMFGLPIPWVEASDIANAVLFLLSDAARYITGVALPVDGGVLLR